MTVSSSGEILTEAELATLRTHAGYCYATEAIYAKLRMSNFRYCRQCDTIKATSDFARSACWCKPCAAVKSREYYRSGGKERQAETAALEDHLARMFENSGPVPDPSFLLDGDFDD